MVMEINSNINNDLDLNAENIKAQMRKGVLEYCILSILRKGDSYVSPLIAELKAAKMIVVEGTLYPLLTRQKNQGLLSYRWEESPSGPPRKYYSLTEKGRKALELMDEAWGEVIKTVDLIKTGIDLNGEEE
jgi:PadR family transcriptional regulator PadR